MLNKDQQRCKAAVVSWWNSSRMNFIVAGAGGVGKTFLVDSIIKSLNVDPLLLAPTHEALNQLRLKISNNQDYSFRTISSALGRLPTTSEKELKFEYRKVSPIWDNHNLAIIDEGSFLSKEEIQILSSIGIKILYLGHKAQLPPINAGTSDSPLFYEDYTTYTLTEPMRNTGSIWKYLQQLEKYVYGEIGKPDHEFYRSNVDILNYIRSEEGKEGFKAGKSKIVAWTNNTVDLYNQKIRTILYGEEAKKVYTAGEQIILTAPVVEIPGMVRQNDIAIGRLRVKIDKLYNVFSNSKGIVLNYKPDILKLNKDLVFPVYRLKVYLPDDGKEVNLVELQDYNNLKDINDYYDKLAWNTTKASDRESIYKLKHFLFKCLAKVKYYYCGTAHRLQGSTVDNVIVIEKDIERNMNIIEARKCLYVASSRASKELMVYKGSSLF